MSHFGSTAKRLITSSAAIAFSSRIVIFDFRRVSIKRLPVTSAKSRMSSCSCCRERSVSGSREGTDVRAHSRSCALRSTLSHAPDSEAP